MAGFADTRGLEVRALRELVREARDTGVALTGSDAFGPPSTPWWRADPWGRDVAAGIGEADGGFARCENFPASGEDAFGWSPVWQTPRYEDTQRWADYRPMPLQTHP